MDRDGTLNNIELQHMIDVLLFVAKENKISFLAPKQDINTLDRQSALRLSRQNIVLPTQSSKIESRTLDECRRTCQVEESQEGDASGARNNLDEIYAKLLRDLRGRLSAEGFLSQEEFLMWSVDNNILIAPLLELLFQVCHVSLGLKPHCRHHEYEIGK